MPLLEAPAMNGHAPRRRPLVDDETLTAIREQAAQLRPGRVLLGLIGGLLFSIGWVVTKTFVALWVPAMWCVAAVQVGHRQALGKPLNQPDMNAVMAENARLRAELSRIDIR